MPHKPANKIEFKPVIEPWRCKNQGCQRHIGHAHVVTVNGIANLMLGGDKVFRLEVVCTNCGAVNYYNQREKDMQDQTEAFLRLMANSSVSAE